MARAVAYTATIYEASVDASGERPFLATMLADLRAWNAQDPPDDRERARSSAVAAWQGTENPFVLDPTLLDRAFGDYHQTDPPDPTDPTAVWINEVHYDNAGTDTGEFVEVAGLAGTDLAGWRLVLYNGNGGALYDDRTLSGVLPDEDGGLGALAFHYPPTGSRTAPPTASPSSRPTAPSSSSSPTRACSTRPTAPPPGRPPPTSASRSRAPRPRATASASPAPAGPTPDFVWSGPGPASPGALNVGQAARIATDVPCDPTDRHRPERSRP